MWRDILETNEEVFGAFGIHPHNAKYYDDAVEQRLVQCLEHRKAVAWGECGECGTVQRSASSALRLRS